MPAVSLVTVGELRISPWLATREFRKLIIHNQAEHDQLGRGRCFGNSPANGGARLAADALRSIGLYASVYNQCELYCGAGASIPL